MIKVLIVDDSPTVVALFKHIISAESDMEVVGVAQNGKEAVEMAAALKPDLITMDIQMPVMDGLEATRLIMAGNPTPIVVISSTISDESTKATFHILEAGALTALAKPADMFSPTFSETKKFIIETLRSMAGVAVARKLKIDAKPVLKVVGAGNYEIVAIGSSVGGPAALKTILSHLPEGFPVPIVVVQHMTNGFLNGFVQWLGENTPLKVKTADDKEHLQKGTVYIAPEKRHLQVERTGIGLAAKIVAGEAVSGFCPSITVLFNSVAAVSGKKAIGMILTGMSGDGANGLLEIKKAEGLTLAQDPASAVVYGMAGVAQSIGAVDQVVELNAIAPYLIKATHGK